MKTYFVYILTNKKRGTLYVGATNNISKRIIKHQNNKKGFCYKYNLFTLVYYEEYNEIKYVIAREKQLENWHRNWKINVIEGVNKDWVDVSHETLK
jgi:putative endonuclease